MTGSPHKIAEDQLIGLLKRKDKGAFTILYDNYSDNIYGILYRILNNEDLAADVMQDSFIKVWKKIHTYDPSKGRLFSWLLNIARNTAIDVLRSSEYKHTKSRQPIETILNKAKDETWSTIDNIGLQEIVEKLKPDLKAIIDLIYFQGFTQVETAQELGIPLGTVKSRVRIAMQQLRVTFS